MGFRVSDTVANIVMEYQTKSLIYLWSPTYFLNMLCRWHLYCITSKYHFHRHFNSIEPSTQFTVEIVEDDLLPSYIPWSLGTIIKPCLLLSIVKKLTLINTCSSHIAIPSVICSLLPAHYSLDLPYIPLAKS